MRVSGWNLLVPFRHPTKSKINWRQELRAGRKKKKKRGFCRKVLVYILIAFFSLRVTKNNNPQSTRFGTFCFQGYRAQHERLPNGMSSVPRLFYFFSFANRLIVARLRHSANRGEDLIGNRLALNPSDRVHHGISPGYIVYIVLILGHPR